jgi:hypothetical protein
MDILLTDGNGGVPRAKTETLGKVEFVTFNPNTFLSIRADALDHIYDRDSPHYSESIIVNYYDPTKESAHYFLSLYWFSPETHWRAFNPACLKDGSLDRWMLDLKLSRSGYSRGFNGNHYFIDQDTIQLIRPQLQLVQDTNA